MDETACTFGRPAGDEGSRPFYLETGGREAPGLLALGNRGDPHAREVVARRAAVILHGQLGGFRRMLARQETEVEDVVQDCLITVLRHAGRWNEDPPRFETWLRRIARNRVWEAVRKRRRRPEGETVEFAEEVSPVRGSESLPENDERRILLRRQLLRLSWKQRVTVVLHDFAGLPKDRVAFLLGLPENSAVSAVRARALRRLRALTGAHTDAPSR